MLDNILIMDVENKDGLIFFNDNEDILDLIEAPSNIELGLFNDFDNLNEICEYVIESAYNAIILKFDMSSGMFAKTFTNMLDTTNINIIWLIENSIYSFYSIIEKKIKIFNSYNDLNLYLANKKTNMVNIEETELDQYFLTSNKYSETYRHIMTNGYIAYLTGIYPQGLDSSNTKHIHINKSLDLEKIINSFDINLNSAFFIDVENYEPDLYEKVKQTKGLVSHVHQISKNKIYFDNSEYSINKQDCSLKEYVEFCESNKVNQNQFYIVHISDNQDIFALENILEKFKKTGEILNPNFYLADECRWIGKCELNKFRRIDIIDEKVRTCNTSKTCLYNINDEKIVKLAKINKEREKTQVENCSKCKYDNICSKCSCLPEGISRKVFCQIMNKFPYIQEYFLKKNFMLFLRKTSKVFRDSKISISSQTHPIIYTGTPIKYDSSHLIYLFSVEDKFYIYNFKSSEIIKIDEKLAFILEGYSINDEKTNIINNFKSKYSVEKECATNTVSAGMTLLKQMGFLT